MIDRCCTWILITELFESTLFAEIVTCVLILSSFVCKKMCAKCVSNSIANLYKWIGHDSKHKKFLSNAHFGIVYKIRICMYTKILLTLVCCWFDAWISRKISKKLKTHFFSKFMYQLSPQIKLWGGDV